jgi:hypothetical protein
LAFLLLRMEFQDEDDYYEISNKNVEDYMSEYFPNQTSNLVKSSFNMNDTFDTKLKDENNNLIHESNQSDNPKLDINFELLQNLLQNLSNNVFLDIHREFLLGLGLTSRVSSSIKLSNCFIIVPIFLSLTIISSLIIIFPLTLIIFFLLFNFQKIQNRIFKSIFAMISLKINNYTNQIKNIINFLKQIEQIELSSQREFNFRNNTKQLGSTIQIEVSDVRNFRYRREFFIKSREHFFNLKYLNQRLINQFKLSNKFTTLSENLVCLVDEKDLSNVFHANGSDLDSLTDQYCIDCIKSLLKFNQIMISENILLIILSLVIDEKFYNKSRSIFTNCNAFQSFSNKIDILEKFLKLIDESLAEKISALKDCKTSQNREIVVAKNLGLYLRNCLLNVFEIVEAGKQSNDLKRLVLIKNSFENANLYLQQLETLIDKDFKLKSAQKKQEFTHLSCEKSLEDNKNENVRVVSSDFESLIEDEIFEAEVLNNFEDIEGLNLIKTQEEIEEINREKENQLLNKNLYYELKYALKTKSNEWTQREKKLKNKDHKKNIDQDEIDKVEEYLLENDAMKYKAQLKFRRKYTKDAQPIQIPSKFGDDEIKSKSRKQKYVYDDSNISNESSIGFAFSDKQFLNDFMKQRNNFMLISKNEETIGEQESDFEEI